MFDLITADGEEIRWAGSSAQAAADNATEALGEHVYPLDIDWRMSTAWIAALGVLWTFVLIATLWSGR